MVEMAISLGASGLKPPTPEALFLAGLEGARLATGHGCAIQLIQKRDNGAVFTGTSANTEKRTNTIRDYPPQTYRDAGALLATLLGNVCSRLDIIDDVLRSMAASAADPYTYYVSAKDVAHLTKYDADSRATVHFRLTPDEPQRIKTSLDNGSDGLRSGDIVTKLDGVSVSNFTYQQMNIALVGEPESIVRVEVVRNKESPLTVSVPRKRNAAPPLSGRRIGDVASLRISRFALGTAARAEQIMSELAGAKDTVIDLRGNPGGRVEEAMRFLDVFFRNGKLGAIYAGTRKPATSYFAKDSETDFDGRIIVLVDDDTASAAEWVAMTLQERKRAVVWGYKTTGKGTVQRQIKLPGGGRLFVTAAKYLSAGGAPLPKDGVPLDRVMEHPEHGKQRPDWITVAAAQFKK